MRPTTMSQGLPPLAHTSSMQKNHTPLHTPSLLHDSKGEVEKYYPNHDHNNPQDRRRILHPRPGFRVKDVSTRFLRASGSTEILCNGKDKDIIKLIGPAKQQDATLPTPKPPTTTFYEEILIPHYLAWDILLSEKKL